MSGLHGGGNGVGEVEGVGQVGKGKHEEPDSSKMCNSRNAELERRLEQKSLIALFFVVSNVTTQLQFPATSLSRHL